MLKTSRLLIRSKITADLVLLISIIICCRLLVHEENYLYETDILIITVAVLSWMFSSHTFKLYADYRVKPFSIEWVAFLKTLALHTLLVSSVFFLFIHQEFFFRKQLLLHVSLFFTLMPIEKLFIRIAFKKFANSNNVSRKVLIIGAGNTGINFYEQYIKNEHYGYKLTGFLDDENQPALNGHYLGTTSDIDDILNRYELEDIVVTLPAAKEKQIEKIITAGEKEGKRIRIIPNYECFSNNKLQVDNLGSLSIVTLRSLPLDIVDNKIYKRIFDIFFSILVIVFLLSWLIPIVGLIIKITSKGPIFFKQIRWGLNNKPITCYKFRTMVHSSKDVDDAGNYLQALKNDPRITKMGKFLRKTNIDELPQFINVLLGSMSIVGPRPHPVPLNLMSKDSIENYMMRHWVKPGITGWAQVSGYRGETRQPLLMKKRVEHDLWYMENWSLWFDLEIIVQTVVNMVKGEKNAF